METMILTLTLDETSAVYLTELRTRHFPPERNYLSAHVTLFHALPLDAEVLGAVTECAEDYTPFPVSLPRPFFLGSGTAITVESKGLMTLRARLAARLKAKLTRQDQNGFRPHVTIQNKVPSRAAKAFFEDFRLGWQPREARAEGLDLWVYEGGPWRSYRRYPFTSSCENSPWPS